MSVDDDFCVFGEPYACRRNPLDRYLSWLQFCCVAAQMGVSLGRLRVGEASGIPACDLMEKVDMDQAESQLGTLRASLDVSMADISFCRSSVLSRGRRFDQARSL